MACQTIYSLRYKYNAIALFWKIIRAFSISSSMFTNNLDLQRKLYGISLTVQLHTASNGIRIKWEVLFDIMLILLHDHATASACLPVSCEYIPSFLSSSMWLPVWISSRIRRKKTKASVSSVYLNLTTIYAVSTPMMEKDVIWLAGHKWKFYFFRTWRTLLSSDYCKKWYRRDHITYLNYSTTVHYHYSISGLYSWKPAQNNSDSESYTSKLHSNKKSGLTGVQLLQQFSSTSSHFWPHG